MSDLIEEGVAVEKKFREKIEIALEQELLSNENKVEMIAIAGAEYFSDKLKMMFRFYEENKEVQKQLAQDKINKEFEQIEKRQRLEIFPPGELEILKVIAKYKKWATTAIISRETKHTWITVDKYIKKFMEMGIVEQVPSKMTRKKTYQLNKEFSFVEGGQNAKENKD